MSEPILRNYISELSYNLTPTQNINTFKLTGQDSIVTCAWPQSSLYFWGDSVGYINFPGVYTAIGVYSGGSMITVPAVLQRPNAYGMTWTGNNTFDFNNTSYSIVDGHAMGMPTYVGGSGGNTMAERSVLYPHNLYAISNGTVSIRIYYNGEIFNDNEVLKTGGSITPISLDAAIEEAATDTTGIWHIISNIYLNADIGAFGCEMLLISVSGATPRFALSPTYACGYSAYSGTTITVPGAWTQISWKTDDVPTIPHLLSVYTGPIPATPKYAITLTKVSSGTGDGTLSVPESSVESGTSVTVTATPNTNSYISNVQVSYDETIVPHTMDGNNITFTMPSHAVTVYVTFAQRATYAITTNVIGVGTLSISPPSPQMEGQTISVTESAGDNYAIQSVTAVGTTTSTPITVTWQGNHTYTFVMPAEPVSVTGTFIQEAPTEYGITISKAGDGNGSVGVDPESRQAPEGDTVTLTCVPDAGNYLTNIQVTDGTNIIEHTLNGNIATFTMPASAVTCYVTFSTTSPTSHQINVTKAGTGTGAVGIEPSNRRAEPGETVTVTSVADSDSELTGVLVTAGTTEIPVTLVGNVGTFTMPDNDVTVYVTFTHIDILTISIFNSEGGTVTTEPANSAEEGQTVSIIARPLDGYKLGSLSVTGATHGQPYEYTWLGNYRYTFVMPNESVQIVVTWDTQGGGGTGPYGPEGPSDIGGGGGEFDPGIFSIPIPTYPAVDVTDTGMVSMYKIDKTNLKRLAGYLWSDDFVDTIKKLAMSPLDAIISLKQLPLGTIPTGALTSVIAGKVVTTAQANPITSQYMTVVCGAVSVPAYYGSYLDYSPYTRYWLFLPYCGTIELDADIVSGKTLTVAYNVDLLSGECAAIVGITQEDGTTAIGYHGRGNCAATIPITGADYTQQLANRLGNLGQLASGAAIGSVMGGMFGMGALVNSAIQGIGAGALGAIAAGVGGDYGATVGSVLGGKPAVTSIGGVTPCAGNMDTKIPYLIISRPRLSMPAYYETVEGYPSNVWAALNTLHGFTSFESIALNDMGATDAEIAELNQLLLSGVYL